MASHFTTTEWLKISSRFQQHAGEFGLPDKQNDSILIASFNIRKLGAIKKRTKQSWAFLKNILLPFDLIAIQEVMDDL